MSLFLVMFSLSTLFKSQSSYHHITYNTVYLIDFLSPLESKVGKDRECYLTCSVLYPQCIEQVDTQEIFTDHGTLCYAEILNNGVALNSYLWFPLRHWERTERQILTYYLGLHIFFSVGRHLNVFANLGGKANRIGWVNIYKKERMFNGTRYMRM